MENIFRYSWRSQQLNILLHLQVFNKLRHVRADLVQECSQRHDKTLHEEDPQPSQWNTLPYKEALYVVTPLSDSGSLWRTPPAAAATKNPKGSL
jgi:hypothetical protein